MDLLTNISNPDQARNKTNAFTPFLMGSIGSSGIDLASLGLKKID